MPNNDFDTAKNLHYLTTTLAQEISRTENQLTQQALQEANKPDPENYRGTAEREYKKEIARHYADGGKYSMNNRTDVAVTEKLLMAGHQPEKISQTLNQHSPSLPREIGRNGGKRYGENVVMVAAQNIQRNPRKVQATQDILKFQTQEKFGSIERRLDKLGLEKKVQQKTPPPPPKNKDRKR